MQQVQIWSLALSQCALKNDKLMALLVNDECERAQKMRDSRVFIVARAALRCLLAQQLRCAPQEVVIRYNKYGKPAVDAGSIHFNVSHTSEMIVWAFSDTELGVDVEQISIKRDILSIAKRFFAAAEYQEIMAQVESERISYAFSLWCAKEALVKALGQGISYGFDAFVLSNKNNKLQLLDATDPLVLAQHWHLLPLTINAPNHCSALAISGDYPHVFYHQAEQLLHLIAR